MEPNNVWPLSLPLRVLALASRQLCIFQPRGPVTFVTARESPPRRYCGRASSRRTRVARFRMFVGASTKRTNRNETSGHSNRKVGALAAEPKRRQETALDLLGPA